MFIQRYHLEFVLHTPSASAQTVKNSLAEFGEGMEITDCPGIDENGNNFKINLETEDPTVIFDICGQFGRIRAVKVDEIK